MVRKKNFIKFFWLITIIVIILDQLSKFVVSFTQPNINLRILNVNLIHNTGAGFGILQGQTIWLGLISLIVAFIVIYYYKKIPKEKVPQFLFALFLGGVIGNLIDRLFRRVVIDFIDFSFWPAFNIADACITVSVIGLVVYFWKR